MPDESTFSDLIKRMRRADIILMRAVRRQRARPAMRAKGQFWGSVITDDEVDALLRSHGEIDYEIGSDGLDDSIAASTAYRDWTGGQISLIRERFGLDGDDIDLLLLSLAPEISAGYGKIFAYLNDNLNQAFLTVDLATRVLRQHRTQRLPIQARLLPGAPLIQNRLLLLNPPDGMDTHASRRLHPAPRMLRWLFQGDDVTLEGGAKRLDFEGVVFIPGAARERLAQVTAALHTAVTVVVVGSTMGMREGVAMAVAREVGRPLVKVDVDRAKNYLEQPYELVRDLRLMGAIPFLVNVPDGTEDPQTRAKVINLGTALSTIPYPIVVGGAERKAVASMLGGARPSVTLPVGRSTQPEREAAWESALRNRGWDVGKADHIAERFYSVGGTTIEQVLTRASAEAGGAEPDLDTIWAACREAARPEFSGMAQHIVPRFRWEDLILAPKIMAQLKTLEQYLAQQETVYHRWGANKIRPRGYGIKALFSGGPGTGKTMCAEVIAGSLGLDLFKVDLSSVISRWVGETEKNLKEIFDAAEGGSSIVLFDEADALFGSRGDVKQAQDRFANQEVAFLLQRLEVFEGAVILTTNLQENIDEAFLRRFGAVVEFPMPTPRERHLLWERAIPQYAPRDKSLDLEYIAQNFIVAGGAIINASINGCIQAASEGKAVSQGHILVAIARELHKNGKQVNRVHFGEHFELVKDLF